MGELIQMDASPHVWFNHMTSHLHLAIDDASGTIVGGYFDKQETLYGYHHVLYQILTNHGIPAKFICDRRTIFDYKKRTLLLITKIRLLNFLMPVISLALNFKPLVCHKPKGA